MPIYEYCCEECGHVFEEWQSGFEEKHFPCPICAGDSKRIVSHTSFVLKGSGWYVTDYCNKHTSPNSGGMSKENTPKAPKADSGSKTDAASKAGKAATASPAAS